MGKSGKGGEIMKPEAGVRTGGARAAARMLSAKSEDAKPPPTKQQRTEGGSKAMARNTSPKPVELKHVKGQKGDTIRHADDEGPLDEDVQNYRSHCAELRLAAA